MLKPEATVRRLEVISGRDDIAGFPRMTRRGLSKRRCARSGGFGSCAPPWADAATSVHVAAAGTPARVTRAEAEAPQFVPAIVESSAPRRKRGRPRRLRHDEAAGVIEVEIEGVTVRVGRGAEAKTVAAVLRALKGGA
jgi:transposase